MSDKPKGKLGDFLRQVSNWDWAEFWRAERDKTYTTNEAMIFTLIRSCASENLKAIRLSLNRMDGKLKTPVVIETPKVFFVYPYATSIGAGRTPDQVDAGEFSGKEVTIAHGRTDAFISTEVIEPELVEDDLPSMSLRETLTKMSDYSRDTPDAIVATAEMTEQWLRQQGPQPATIPRVKSVVAAHLLVMAQKKNIDALTEVFDQIDGKLAETIQVIGEDIYINNYAAIAPEGATKNADGLYQLEAPMAQNIWATKLGGTIG